MIPELYLRFEEYVRSHKLISNGDDIVIGVSGGADSVCLLLLLCRLRNKLDLRLKAAHMDHMIRGAASKEDADFVKELCAKLDVECVIKTENVPELAKRTGTGLEEAGRRARYEFMCALAKKDGAAIALAHHMNDSAETFVLNLARGTRLKGLSGIRAEGSMNGCRLIRPLIFAKRQEIEAFLEEEGAAFRMDATNDDTGYSRNFIRHELLPRFTRLNKNSIEHIAETADYITRVECYLEKETDAACERILTYDNEGRPVIDVDGLNECDPLIAERVIYKAVTEAVKGSRDVGSVHIKRVAELAGGRSGRSVPLIRGFSAVREYGRILIGQKDSKEVLPGEIRIEKSGLESGRETVIELEDGARLTLSVTAVNNGNRQELIQKKLYTKAFDYDKINNAVILGTKALGDRIFLKNGSKSLKKFFTDEKIPAGKRNEILLLKDDESIVWIIGYRISEAHKIGDTTKKALIARISGGAYGQ